VWQNTLHLLRPLYGPVRLYNSSDAGAEKINARCSRKPESDADCRGLEEKRDRGTPSTRRQRSGLRLDCLYRDAFAGAPKEPLPPFHILPIDGEQLGTRAPCSQSDQNIRGVIAQRHRAKCGRSVASSPIPAVACPKPCGSQPIAWSSGRI
jgi:hypothetical protein